MRLALLALQGVKSAIVEIEEISSAFCSSPADRTSHRVPNLWCRSSSTNALGQILKSINHTALVVYFLQKFVNFYLFSSRKVAGESRNKIDEDEVSYDNNVEVQPPYSLVNHAFSVAVKKVLEGYFCSLSTLLASVKLRRLNAPSSITKGKIGKTTTVSEVTILEVYLHTEELRRLIQSLGNICFPKFADLDLWREDLNTDTNFEFHNFPKGADLLSYLYVQFRVSHPLFDSSLHYDFFYMFAYLHPMQFLRTFLNLRKLCSFSLQISFARKFMGCSRSLDCFFCSMSAFMYCFTILHS